ncbi:hypothetical protein CDL60_18585 [Roseateles noduli]|nr:hypothetical protein CDL60_18585 [Roseateles noduli]
MTIRQIVLAALTASLSAGASAASDAEPGTRAREKCYDLVKAGQHECAGPSARDRVPDEWAYVVQEAA